MTLFSSSNLIIYISKLVSLFTAITVFTIINLSSLQADEQGSFEDWLIYIENLALKEGISKDTINNSIKNITQNERVLELDRSQPEFTLTLEKYLSNTTSASRVKKGKKLYKENKNILEKVSNEFGVQPRFLLALWGIETSFGKFTGSFNVIRSLSTLSHDLRRRDFFTEELINALKIINEGHIDAENMMGSWAGAMGQNQFMPSSFLSYAIDYNNDERKDIWTTLEDVFASSANYLSSSGWDNDLTWGREVITTKPINKDLITTSAKKIEISKKLSEWSELGVLKANGEKLPNKNLDAYLVFPEGEDGKKFLVYENFKVIMKWNRSLFFGISVGTLSDMIEYH